ncbi:hypothetical protein AgCh_017336 [Apium graveolens]
MVLTFNLISKHLNTSYSLPSIKAGKYSRIFTSSHLQMAKCKATYFIVVLHHLKSVVIAVRGTESPEDLITDALCRECYLTAEELDGLRRYAALAPLLRHRRGLKVAYIADSESSSIRSVDLKTGGSKLLAGGDPVFSDNLFWFGDHDGTDSYNHKVAPDIT